MMKGPSQTVADFVVTFSKVVGSSILTDTDTGENIGIAYNVTGIAGLDLSGDNPEIQLEDNQGEQGDESEVWTALGLIGRPLPPTTSGGKSKQADVICLRMADELIPIATHDNRLSMGGNGPNEGTIGLIGYGGGFYSLAPIDPDDLGAGTRHVIYCPYDPNADGVPQKAHSITIDPTPNNESISIVHAEGMAMTMLTDGKKTLNLKNAAGDASLRLDDDGITATAATISLIGKVILGATAVGALPLLAGSASPPGPSVYISPV